VHIAEVLALAALVHIAEVLALAASVHIAEVLALRHVCPQSQMLE